MSVLEILKISAEELCDIYKTNLPLLYATAVKNQHVEAFEQDIKRYITSRKYYGQQAEVSRALLRIVEYNGTRVEDAIYPKVYKLVAITELWLFLKRGYYTINFKREMLLDLYFLFLQLTPSVTEEQSYSSNHLRNDMKRWSKASDNDVTKLMLKNRDKLISAIARIPEEKFPLEYRDIRSMPYLQRKEKLVELWHTYRFQVDFAMRKESELRLLLSGVAYRKLSDVSKILSQKKEFILTPYHLSLFNNSLNGFDDITLRHSINFIDRLNNDFFRNDNDTIFSLLTNKINNTKGEKIEIETDMLSIIPQRFDCKLLSLLADICTIGEKLGIVTFQITTAFQSPLELTQEVRDVINQLHQAGWQLNNSAHFTIAISRRGQLSHLREMLNKEGILSSSVYALRSNCSSSLFAPICRSEQESCEEKQFGKTDSNYDGCTCSSLATAKDNKKNIKYYMEQSHVPFIDSDKYLFELGITTTADHCMMVGINGDGRRIFRFDCRDSDDAKCGYYSEAMAVSDYLSKLTDMGENIDDYRSIWGYV